MTTIYTSKATVHAYRSYYVAKEARGGVNLVPPHPHPQARAQKEL